MTSRWARRRPASRSWRQGSLARLVGLGHRPQPCADPRRQGCGKRGLAGAGWPVKQKVDAALPPVKRRPQHGCRDFRLPAEMREGIPRKRGRGGRAEQLVVEIGRRQHVPGGSATVSRSSTFSSPSRSSCSRPLASSFAPAVSRVSISAEGAFSSSAISAASRWNRRRCRRGTRSSHRTAARPAYRAL